MSKPTIPVERLICSRDQYAASLRDARVQLLIVKKLLSRMLSAYVETLTAKSHPEESAKQIFEGNSAVEHAEHLVEYLESMVETYDAAIQNGRV